MTQHILADQAASLTEGLSNYVIHGVHEYEHLGGICLVMQYCARRDDPATKEVGVTAGTHEIKLDILNMNK